MRNKVLNEPPASSIEYVYSTVHAVYSIVTKIFINVMWNCSTGNKLIKKKRIMDRCLNMSV